MEQRISVLTLGAQNLEAMKTFYEQVLGWKPVAQNKDVVFYPLNGFLLSLCDRKRLAEFIGIPAEGTGFRAVTIGYNVDTEEEVWQLFDKLKKEVNILKPPTTPPFGGVFFYFSDIEGNIIEVACNSFVLLDKAQNAIGHQPIDHL